MSIVDALQNEEGKLDKEKHEDSEQEVLEAFPRFQGSSSSSDRAVRQDALASAINLISTKRMVEIRKDPGANSLGFISCICEDFRRQAPDSPVLTINCADVSTGKLLQESIEFSARASVPILAVAIQESERCLLVLEDLDEVGEQAVEKSATIYDTIEALLDFCPNLSLIRTSSLPLSNEQCTRVGALDEADTRAYLDSKTSKQSFFDSNTDYSRVHRATSGLPVYLDDVVNALTVTNFEGALAQIDSSPIEYDNALRPLVKSEIITLRSTDDDFLTRARNLLWILSVLERGESLSALKRLVENKPFFAKQAFYLQSKGCLDVLSTTPRYYGTLPSIHPAKDDKILRVPRLVRDYVLSKMEDSEKEELIRGAAELYFASDWRSGTVRMRRRVAFGAELSSHQSGNEMTILRFLVLNPSTYFVGDTSNAFSLVLSYISQLKAKGFYGEAYEAAREFLGLVTQCKIPPDEKQKNLLQRFAGSSARMIGEREACVVFLTEALPVVRQSKQKSQLTSTLVELSLALQTLGRSDEAKSFALEVLKETPKETSDYFQARSILIEVEDEKPNRHRRLKTLRTRARNLGHHTAADNIALNLASETNNTNEKLKLLGEIKRRGERAYNYVRATIRRIETLLDSGRKAEISPTDVDDLWHSYNLAYSQRMTGIFESCHRICWRFLSETGRQNHLGALFVYSSFVWRLNGRLEAEQNYLKQLTNGSGDFITDRVSGSQNENYVRARWAATKD